MAQTLSKEIVNSPDIYKAYKHFEKVYILFPLIHSENVETCQLGVNELNKLL